MKFSGKEDIEAPIDQVFALISDFETLEGAAVNRGVEVERLTTLVPARAGISWRAKFRFRGRGRETTVTVQDYDDPNRIRFSYASASFSGHFLVELNATAANRTRMSVSMEFAPLNLTARLIVQSLRLAKSRLNKRFKQRLAEYAQTAENQLRAP